MASSNYCALPSLRFAKERIKNPPQILNSKGDIVNTPFEHHVGSWALTMVSSVFRGSKWIITPEMIDQNTRKRPDIVVEKLDPEGIDSRLHLLIELKSSNGDRFEDALAQVVAEKEETLEIQTEVYIVVLRGTKIGFFEYHNDVSNLDEEDISHFKGCISLTQGYSSRAKSDSPLVRQEPVLKNLPKDLDLLFHNHTHLKNYTDDRDDAISYKIPCVFDLDKHEKEIDYLFNHMANHEPRSSIPE
jgi:hypothetical protein